MGGLKLNSRESDLAIIGSLLSSYKGQKIKNGLILLGEIGLTGKIRSSNYLETRMKELEMLEYSEVITCKKIAKMYRDSSKVKVTGIESAEELMKYAFG